MEYQNVIYTEKEYREFGKVLIDTMPELDDELEDQDVINMYNQIRQQEPSATHEEIIKTTPKIVLKIKEEMEKRLGKGSDENLAALNMLGE